VSLRLLHDGPYVVMSALILSVFHSWHEQDSDEIMESCDTCITEACKALEEAGSTRFLIFDKYADIVAQYQIEYPQYYPEPG